MSQLLDSQGGGLKLRMHPGQVRAWNSQSRFVAVTAGTQSGKTSFGPYWLLREIQNVGPCDAMVVTPTYPLLELKLLGEFRHLFERVLHLGTYVATPYRRFIFSEAAMRKVFRERYDARTDAPARVLFGYATDPESLESATIGAAWLDEAGQKKFKLGAWQAILRRLSLAVGRALITTSIYTLGWLKQKYDAWLGGDRDWDFINFDSTENPAFPPEEFERARRDLPLWKFNMLYRGRFTRPAGLIYDCIDEQTQKIPRFVIPREWHRYLGLDFGSVNMAGTFWAEEPGTRRLYLYRTYHESGESVQGHVRRLLHGEPGIPYCVGGSSGEDDWRGDFRKYGLPVREPKIKDVEVGINRTYGVWQRGEAFAFDDLEEGWEELTTYSRVLDEKGEPTETIEDKNTFHLLDSMRYVLSDIRAPVSNAPTTVIRAQDPLNEVDASGY